MAPVRPSRPSDLAAIVTGANHGIGAATAIALAREGVKVLAAYHAVEGTDPAETRTVYRQARARTADWVVDAIRSAGGTAVASSGDLSNAETPAALFDLAEEELGPVRILVNNASSWAKDTFVPGRRDAVGRRPSPISEKSHDRQFAVDARGAALLIAEFARRHIARGDRWGRIVGLTSGGPGGFPGEVSYGAAKAALENYTMSAAKELADHGVTANVVMPPVTDTGWVTDEVRAFVDASTDHTHVASPDDVAEVIAWLCSDAAYLVSGNRLVLR